jgi:hypothetical protein
MIEIDNVEVSFDINTLEMSGYLLIRFYGFAHFGE